MSMSEKDLRAVPGRDVGSSVYVDADGLFVEKSSNILFWMKSDYEFSCGTDTEFRIDDSSELF